ncbi:MAG: alpha/beta fold hydrolase [Telluria sp.]
MQTTFAASLLLLAPLAAAAAAPGLIPINFFTHTADYSMAKLSPDGKHVAVAVRRERDGMSIPTLTVYAVPEMKYVSTITLPDYDTPANIRWLTSARLAVLKDGAFKNAQGWSATAPEVIAVNIDGTQPQYLFGPRGSQQTIEGQRYGDDYSTALFARVPILRDGHVMLDSAPWHSNRSILYDIDSVTAARKVLAEIPAKSFIFTMQHDGKPRFAWGRQDNRPQLYRLDDASGRWDMVKLDAAISRYRTIGFTRDDKAVYASIAQDGAPLGLVREDMATGVRTPIGGDPLGDINQFEFTAGLAAPFAYRSNVGIPRARYLDDKAPETALHKTLSASFPSAYVEFLSFSDDGQRLLFRVGSDRDPGSYFLFDQKSAKATFLFAHMAKIDRDRMARSRPITFTARDGLTLTGYLTLPAAAAHAKLPMVLLPHGGPGGFNDWFFDTTTQFLASRGYAVLQVNFRGSGGRGLLFEAAGHAQLGLKMMDDLMDSVAWAAAQPGIDGSRVCVVGESFGAYAALTLPARAPAMFKCAAGRSGYYDLANRYTRKNTVDTAPARRIVDKFMGDDPALLRRQSPVMFANDIAVPVLRVKGIRDDVFVPKQAESMRDALTLAGRAPEWLVEEEVEDPHYSPQRQQAFYARLEAFLAKHLAKSLTAAP